MDFTNQYDHKRHEYFAYGKINKLLIPVIYNRMCNDLPYYRTPQDLDCNLKDSILENRLSNIYSHYYPYKGYVTIDVEIMRWYNGSPSQAYNHRKTLFHKNVGRLNIIHKEKYGYIVKTITLQRMVPLLGKVKDIL